MLLDVQSLHGVELAVKIAVLAPMPRASAATAAMVKPGFLRNMRSERLIDFDRKRTPLHAFPEDDRMGIDCKDSIRFFRQLRRWNVHGDDPARLDLLRDELLRLLRPVEVLEEQ